MSVKRRRDERGFALVMFSMTLVGLLTFAAFAVDLGALYNHRRQDQNAADAGALAAAQELDDTNASLVATAKSYVHDTLGVVIPDADWNSCGSEPVPGFTQISGANCISRNTRQVRVRIPDQEYETTFGRVVGADSFTHAAFAVAALQTEGFGGVLPYAVTGVSAGGGFGCLQSNSNGQASAWCGSTSGNFGFLDFTHYGNPDLGTTQSCGSGDINVRVRANSAMGVDHDLSLIDEEYPGEVVVDSASCPTLRPSPNAATTQTGNQSNDITEGLFDWPGRTFPDGGPSRLQREDQNLFGGSAPRIDVFGVEVDNSALWRFIPPNYGPGETTTADIPSSCKRDQFVDSNGNYYAANADNPDVPDGVEAFLRSSGLVQPRDRILGLLARCFTHYRGQTWNGSPVGSLIPAESAPTGCSDNVCNSPVFALNSSTSDQPDLFDIQYTPRFGYVPQISDFPSGTSQPRQFIRFRPIYIYRLLFEVSGGTVVFDPGVTPAPPTSGSYNRIGETSVFVFPDGMLPGGLASADAPFEIEVNRFVRLIR